MEKRNPQQCTILLIIMFFLILTPSAYAYLDPGTGSFIFQMLIAGMVGAVFAIKIFWASIKSFIYSLFSKNKNKDDRNIA